MNNRLVFALPGRGGAFPNPWSKLSVPESLVASGLDVLQNCDMCMADRINIFNMDTHFRSNAIRQGYSHQWWTGGTAIQYHISQASEGLRVRLVRARI